MIKMIVSTEPFEIVTDFISIHRNFLLSCKFR